MMKRLYYRLQRLFAEFFGLGRAVTLSIIVFTSVVLVVGMVWFIRSAPPDTVVISTGPAGTRFERIAKRYAKLLAQQGVAVTILNSAGSEENLKRLADPTFHADVAFVQGGLARDINTADLVSLGSIAYQPMFVFYRGNKPITLLSQLEGRRIGIGMAGSGTQILARKLLALNGIKPGGKTPLIESDSDDAARDLLAGKIDAVFMMTESAEGQTLRSLVRARQIHLYSFAQAGAYVRRIHYLNKLVFPRGVLNLGKDFPPDDITLIGPSIELIARKDFHPALSDLLLDAAREVHGRAGFLQRAGEFPAPYEREYPISEDAQRYYTSGKSFLYRSLPFTLASMINRLLVVVLPMLVILIPGLKLIPALYRWKVNLGIYRWYRALLGVEHELMGELTPEKQAELQQRLDQIERVVNAMRVPASFGGTFYFLRGHIGFVRERLMKKMQGDDRV